MGNAMTRIPLSGGPAVALAPLGVAQYTIALAQNATHLFWTAYGSGLVDPVTMMSLGDRVAIFRVPKTGGQVEVIGSVEGGSSTYDTALTLDATHLYWSQNRYRLGDPSFAAWGVFRMPLAGGVPELFAPNEPNVTDIAVNATHVYWIGARNAGDQTASGRLVRAQK
jgi:hypothetical protein